MTTAPTTKENQITNRKAAPTRRRGEKVNVNFNQKKERTRRVMARGYLNIKVDADAGNAFVTALEEQLREGWRRDVEYEKRCRMMPGGNARSKEFYIYRREEGPKRTAHLVYVLRRDAETLYVANIFPEESGYLSQEEYNGIQRDFQKQVEKTEYPSVITGEKATLVLSEKAQDKFHHFLRNANPSTGTAHPGDQRLWMEFLVTAYRDGCVPDGSVLCEYMIETFRWEPKVVSLMGVEAEFAKRLLRVEREMRPAREWFE